MFSKLPQIVAVVRIPHCLVEQGLHPVHGKDGEKSSEHKI